MIGAVAYDDPAKDAWRGWKWNTIAAMLTGWKKLNPKEQARQLADKLAIYLVGPNDLDRKAAIARGFRNENLIAVDVVQERVDEVRRNGGFAICGAIQQISANWPEDWPIDVIDADFCCGVTNDVMMHNACLKYSSAVRRSTVISVNMMRGRDSQSNTIRSEMRQLSVSAMKSFEAVIPGLIGVKDAVKHRALSWIAWHLADSDTFPDAGEEGEFLRIAKYVLTPRANWYRSKTSGQYFDSIVHRLGYDARPYAAAQKLAECRARTDQMLARYEEAKHYETAVRRKEMEGYIDEMRKCEATLMHCKNEFSDIAKETAAGIAGGITKLIKADEGIRRRIAALRAVRTKYLQGAA